jgi:predicted  nucleic acid-binding Zn-ribbon protein
MEEGNIKDEIEMMNKRPLEELNGEIAKLSEEYARLKNKPKPFETETEMEVREDQLRKDKREKWHAFDSLRTDFEKKRDYVLNLRKEVEDLKVRERKDELEQKLKDGTVTEKELLELQALNNILLTKT